MIRCLRIGALIATLLTGCSSDSPVDNAVDAAVGIRASGCGLVDRLGTGAVVDAGDRTLIVTSAHTVAGSGTITVERLGQRSAVDLLALDPARDLALLTVPPWAGTGRPLTEPEAGAPVRLAFWSADDGITIDETQITRLLRVTIEDIYVNGEYERRAFEVTAPIERGHSGAPVIAADGQIFGIVYARSRDRGGIAFAVSAAEIAPLVSASGDTPVDSGRCA